MTQKIENFSESGTLLDSSVPPQTVLILLDVVPPTRRFRPVVNYHYGESWEDQGILTLEHLKDTLGVLRTMLVITTEPSHRFTGAHHSVMLRLF